MPRAAVTTFIGPSNKLQANVTDPERTINLYLENTPPGMARVPLWMVGTPGLAPWVVLGGSPGRGMFEQDGRAFAVAGAGYYEIFNPPSSTSRGTVAQDEFFASICSNGSAGDQNMIISGGNGYVHTLSSNAFAQITDPDFPSPARMGAFMDGYGIVSKADSRRFQISALEDFTDWDALDFFERSEGSDNIVSLIRNNRLIWLLGSKTSEVWADVGDPLTPFQPMQGTFIEHGSAAPFGVQRLGNLLAWLSQNENGQGEVVVANDFNPKAVSSYSIARILQEGGLAADGDLSKAVGWSYQENGHLFYNCVVPSATSTVCMDLTMPGIWHERARYSGGNYIAHVVNSHMAAFGRHLVGDRFSGAVYLQSLDLFNEQIVT